MENKVDIKKINEKIEKESAFIDLLRSEMNKVIVGQKNMIDKLLIGLLAKGHILLEGVPGLAKTLAIIHYQRQLVVVLVEYSLLLIYYRPMLLVPNCIMLSNQNFQ